MADSISYWIFTLLFLIITLFIGYAIDYGFGKVTFKSNWVYALSRIIVMFVVGYGIVLAMNALQTKMGETPFFSDTMYGTITIFSYIYVGKTFFGSVL